MNQIETNIKALSTGSAFAGIGGLDLGLEASGACQVSWQIEQDAYCREVLQSHFPASLLYGDITKINFKELPSVEIICGGFPCQDISIAGKRLGLQGDRSGLFWKLFGAIVLVRPRYIVLENVSNIVHSGVAATVSAALASIGFDLEWSIVRAEDIGAPHERERWFCIAWMADAMRARREELNASSIGGKQELRLARRFVEERSQRVFKSSLDRALDGVSFRLDSWPECQGRRQADSEPRRTKDERTNIKTERSQIKALGNAVVPPVACIIGAKLMMIRSILELGVKEDYLCEGLSSPPDRRSPSPN